MRRGVRCDYLCLLGRRRICGEDVLAGRINPGLVFDYETDLEHVEEVYRAMDARRAIKSLLRIGTV